MRKFPRFISQQIAQFIPEQILYNSNTPVFLPFYHTVSNKKLPYILNYPHLNPTEFEKELDYFLKHFKPVSLDYLLQNRNTEEKVFHLSFDDGLRECAEVIAPILLKKGIPATFFVNSGFANNNQLFHRYKASLILSELVKTTNSEAEIFLNKNGLYRNTILQTGISQVEILNKTAEILNIDFFEFLKTRNPYLTTMQISELKNKGFTIGAHSENHPEFYTISEDDQLNEIRKSVNWVVENFNAEIKTFSFPFTDDGVSINLLQKLKSENICDITFGTAGLKYDECKSHLQRYPAEQNGNFKLNLKSEFMYFKIRQLIGKATVVH